MASFPVLLVDDDELSLEVVALQLASIGHPVWKAPAGEKALEMLSQGMERQAQLPEAVITDLQMPDMDGATLCSRVRCLGVYRPRILAMSATRPASSALAGFDGFLLKPLDLDSLRVALGPSATTPPPGKKPPRRVVVSTKIRVAEPLADPVADPILDAAILRKLRMLMPPAAVTDLLTAYLTDTRARLGQMEGFADTGDRRSLRGSAHMIKGAAGMAGATRIARIAARLESEDLPTGQQKLLIDELRCACDALEGTLAREDRDKEAHDQPNTRIG